MKNLLYSLILTISLSGCITSGLPSGIANNGCGNNCQSKDYYLPGKGVWADDKPMSKAKIGGGIGTLGAILLTHSSGDPLLISAAAVAGLVLGYHVGDTFDKIDEMYATMLLSQSLDSNNNFQSSSWKHPQKNIAVNAMPLTSEGECREFVTSIQINKELKQMRGTACKINNEWQLKEIY
jgi:surface antigen|tara:strand:+ start:40 stop:579 length:540 start_codon:yes stop_codon:yes gene_type:complete